MYKLLKDKINEFQCEIKLEGTSAASAKVRLFLEGDGCEYSFVGKIDGEKCVVPMNKLKKYSGLLESGKIRLEVIADDTLFVPYESTYELQESKKVTVEVYQQEATPKKPLVEVKVQEQKPEPKPQPKPEPKPEPKAQKKDPLQELKQYLNNKTAFNGTIHSLKTAILERSHKEYFNTYCKKNKLDRLTVIKQILK